MQCKIDKTKNIIWLYLLAIFIRYEHFMLIKKIVAGVLTSTMRAKRDKGSPRAVRCADEQLAQHLPVAADTVRPAEPRAETAAVPRGLRPPGGPQGLDRGQHVTPGDAVTSDGVLVDFDPHDRQQRQLIGGHVDRSADVAEHVGHLLAYWVSDRNRRQKSSPPRRRECRRSFR